MLPRLFRPQGVDPGHVARPQPSGLDQLAGHDELRLLAKKAGTGRDPEPCAPRPQVLALDLVAGADVRQEAGQQRPVDGVEIRIAVTGAAGHVESHPLAGLSELLLQVLPFSDPQVVEEFGLAHPTKGTGGQCFLLLLHVTPEV
jgi:hypothetical protein